MAAKLHTGVTELRKAGQHRLADAKVLFAGGRWRGAMYLAGYAVECLLKFKLMRQWQCRNLVELEDRLQEKRIAFAAYTHSLELLLRMAGGKDRLRNNDILWRKFSNRVNGWQPAWRYDSDLSSAAQAEDFLEAVQEVLSWIENNL